MNDVTPAEAHVASRYDGEIIEAYLPRLDGDCDLLWMFDGTGLPEGQPRKYLLARLTEDEARKVFERDRTKVGILEPVRHSMKHAEARIFQNLFEGGDQRGVGTITIPAEGDELAFLDALDASPVRTVGDFVQLSRNQIAELHQMERDLDTALATAGSTTRLLVAPYSMIHRWKIRRLRRKIARGIREERVIADTVTSGATRFEHALI